MLISEHHTAAEAFAEMERLAAEIRRTSGRVEGLDLLVVDADGTVVRRPGAH